MQKIVLFLFVFLLIVNPGYSVVIEGVHPEYAGKEISFYKFSDPVSLNKDFVFKILFDKNGKFKTSVDVTENLFVFSNFGIYEGMFFLEPEKNIELVFPPLREKSFAEEKNPFFKPVQFWINTKNKTDLTSRISSFDQYYNLLSNKYFNKLFFQQSKETYDSVLFLLNQKFTKNTSSTFETFKRLKIKSLEADVFRLPAHEVSEIFATVPSEEWVQPSFFDLFKKTFDNKLSFEAKTIKGTTIRDEVAKGNLDFLLEMVQTKYKLKGEIQYITVLKLLYDGFYSGEFAKTSILKIIESKKLTNHSSIIIRNATKNSIDKLKLLQKGSEAPIICLNDLTNKRQCTNSNTEKFKYIVFADTEMIVCREQLKYLTKIHQQFQKNLEIFVVLRKTNLLEMNAFFEKNSIPGMKLLDENAEFIEKYKVKSFPVCFLLDENHQVQFQETKSPLDGFEQQFNGFLRRELFERQRRQSR